jgi:hypothetical protein
MVQTADSTHKNNDKRDDYQYWYRRKWFRAIARSFAPLDFGLYILWFDAVLLHWRRTDFPPWSTCCRLADNNFKDLLADTRVIFVCHRLSSAIRSLSLNGIRQLLNRPSNYSQVPPQQLLPSNASIPSRAIIGTITRAATESAHHQCKVALSTRPINKMAER